MAALAALPVVGGTEAPPIRIVVVPRRREPQPLPRVVPLPREEPVPERRPAPAPVREPVPVAPGRN